MDSGLLRTLEQARKDLFGKLRHGCDRTYCCEWSERPGDAPTAEDLHMVDKQAI
jgi:hypothetical protein